MSETTNLVPLSQDMPALVVILDEAGDAQLFKLPSAQAETLRTTLGPPADTAEGREHVNELLANLSRIARKREEIAEAGS